MTAVLLLDTDVLIDVQRGHAAALAWFAGLTDLPSVPGLVVMELIQTASFRPHPRPVSWSHSRRSRPRWRIDSGLPNCHARRSAARAAALG